VDGRTDDLAPLAPSKTDADAGTWKTVLLTGPSEFAVAAPIGHYNTRLHCPGK